VSQPGYAGRKRLALGLLASLGALDGPRGWGFLTEVRRLTPIWAISILFSLPGSLVLAPSGAAHSPFAIPAKAGPVGNPIAQATASLGLGVARSTNSSTHWTHLSTPSQLIYRSGAPMAYDALDGYVVLYGVGRGSNETWAWADGSWTNMTSGHGPGPRVYPSMTYDAKDHKVVLFGGCYLYLGCPTETWTYAGGNWTKLTPRASPPPSLQFGAMAYDGKDGYVVLFGGSVATSGGSADTNATWKFSGGNWTNISSAVAPSPRYGSSMSYDAKTQLVVLFGGGTRVSCYGTCPMNDTWTFGAGVWTRMATTGGPPARYGGGMAYDRVLGTLVLFGGFGPPGGGGSAVNWTWEFDNVTWTNVTGVRAPVPQYLPQLAYDARVGAVVFFGQHHFWPRATSGTTWKFA
jgi:hypothetical protein